MKKFLQKKLKDQKGMTLIELLAVIVIIAIIAAIAIPAIANVIENSRVGAMKSDATNALNAAQIFLADNPDHYADAATPADEVILYADLVPGYLDNGGTFTAFTITEAANGLVFTGNGSNGNIELKIDKATKNEIAAYPNNERVSVNTDASGSIIAE